MTLNFIREPILELGVIRDKLWEAYQTDRIGSDPAFAKFIYDELMPTFCPAIEKEYGIKAEVRRNFRLNFIRIFSGSRLWLTWLRL